MFANCSNWCKNDVIGGWNVLYGVLLTCGCSWPIGMAGAVNDANGLDCDWFETDAEYICGEVERLSAVSLQ